MFSVEKDAFSGLVLPYVLLWYDKDVNYNRYNSYVSGTFAKVKLSEPPKVQNSSGC